MAKHIDTDKPNAIELAKDIVTTLTNFIVFTEPDEVDDDYAERIKKSHELLVYDENAADKKAVKEMMDSLNEKIAKATKSWKGVDVDEFMDEMRGREPEVDFEKEIEKMWNVFIETEAGRGVFSDIAHYFYELGRLNARKEE